jgi:hypothetical protein
MRALALGFAGNPTIRTMLFGISVFVAIGAAPSAGDELDDLSDNPSAFCQHRWMQVADMVKGDAKTLAKWRDEYAQVYADCMKGTAAEIAKRRKETLVERLVRDDLDRWGEECRQEYPINQVQLSRSPSVADRAAALKYYFTVTLEQCVDAKIRLNTQCQREHPLNTVGQYSTIGEQKAAVVYYLTVTIRQCMDAKRRAAR